MVCGHTAGSGRAECGRGRGRGGICHSCLSSKLESPANGNVKDQCLWFTDIYISLSKNTLSREAGADPSWHGEGLNPDRSLVSLTLTSLLLTVWSLQWSFMSLHWGRSRRERTLPHGGHVNSTQRDSQTWDGDWTRAPLLATTPPGDVCVNSTYNNIFSKSPSTAPLHLTAHWGCLVFNIHSNIWSWSHEKIAAKSCCKDVLL